MRVSVLVKESGNYTASVFGTCNSGGQLSLTVDDYAKAGEATVSKTSESLCDCDGLHETIS